MLMMMMSLHVFVFSTSIDAPAGSNSLDAVRLLVLYRSWQDSLAYIEVLKLCRFSGELNI